MDARYRGWALFFAVLFGCIALFIFHVTGLRPRSEGRSGMLVVLVVLLVAARFAFAAFTGRIPRWMIELIDNPE